MVICQSEILPPVAEKRGEQLAVLAAHAHPLSDLPKHAIAPGSPSLLCISGGRVPVAFFANDCSHRPSKHHALSSCSARWPSEPHDRSTSRRESALPCSCPHELVMRRRPSEREPFSRPPFIGTVRANNPRSTLTTDKADGSHSFSSRIDPPPLSSRLTTSRVWLDVKKAPRRTNREHPALSLADLINTHDRTRVSRAVETNLVYHQPREWSLPPGRAGGSWSEKLTETPA